MWRRGHEASRIRQWVDHLAYPGREGDNEADIASFSLQGSEKEVQEIIKEGHNNFGTVDLGHNLEASRPEAGTGKEKQS